MDNWQLIKEASIYDPAFAAKMGLKVGAAGDFVASGFAISNWAKAPKVGDDLFVDIVGEVNDVFASTPGDNWGITVAVAVVDTYNNPLSANRVFKSFTSPMNGKKWPYDNIIIISDLIGAVKIGHTHLVFGPMPNNQVRVWVELFGSHVTNVEWTWASWRTSW